MRWYALKVFYNRFSPIEATLARDGVESYIPMTTKTYSQPDGTEVSRRVPLVAMLMFIRCDEDYIQMFNSVLHEKAMVYHHPGTQIPAAIRDEEMDRFIYLTSLEDAFEAIPYTYKYTQISKKYVVTCGEYKGAVGYFARYKNAKRLIVPLEDLLMIVAKRYVPVGYIQELRA